MTLGARLAFAAGFDQCRLREAKMPGLIVLPNLDWSPERRLRYDAWADADSMRVYADLLLERGVVKEETEEHAKSWARSFKDMEPRDWALYDLEAQVRSYILSDSPYLMLRVTGGWPDIYYVVVITGRDGKVKDRVSFRGAPIEGVLRLLR